MNVWETLACPKAGCKNTNECKRENKALTTDLCHPYLQVSRPHPSDNPHLFLFLVGGVTPSELRLIKETVATLKPGTQVLVLSNRLLRPTDVPDLLFASQRLAPDIGV
ncbi:sec1 family domain-containing protein 2-like [Entelurus aequoreus]|uniref:sec1 family domain-containing protein 2-like n=1 Tax=Entelurus aequoreus TaxID=161455 RepID=UPI002B1E0233|nr:sec1 family domain-containing protein 2-like [Entelurus aequoreus]